MHLSNKLTNNPSQKYQVNAKKSRPMSAFVDIEITKISSHPSLLHSSECVAVIHFQ